MSSNSGSNGETGNGGDSQAPPPPTDPDALGKAHERYGRYLREAGLPFEPEEFEEEDPSAARHPDADLTEEE